MPEHERERPLWLVPPPEIQEPGFSVRVEELRADLAGEIERCPFHDVPRAVCVNLHAGPIHTGDPRPTGPAARLRWFVIDALLSLAFVAFALGYVAAIFYALSVLWPA